jgi:hypothetical protein
LIVEAGSNTSTVALLVVGVDEKRTQCLGMQSGHPAPDGHKYGDLAIQVRGFSNLREQNVVMSSAGIKSVNDCTGEDQQQL